MNLEGSLCELTGQVAESGYLRRVAGVRAGVVGSDSWGLLYLWGNDLLELHDWG